MSYSATGLPNSISINSSTGLISGTPTTASSTPYTVTVTANDGTSRSSQTFSWTVSALNLVSPADQTNNDGDTVSLSLTTGYHGTGTLSYSANNSLPPGLSINTQTGQITGTISNTADTNSPYSVTVTVTDGTNTSSQTFNWTVNPVVSLDALDDQSNADGDSVSLPVSASDALNNTLTYSATGLPPGLTIGSTTGLISGTINAGADSGSPYAVTVTVTDSAGLSATQTFNWNVAAVGLTNPGPQSSVDGQAVSLQVQGSAGATYIASGLPSDLSINGNTGLISGTLASNADTNSPYVVTVTATLGSNSASQTFLWTVTPIGLTVPSDQTNTEGDVVSLQLQGLSNGGSLTYSASGLPDGLSLNPTTGLITGTIASGAAADGPFTVDVAVSNGTVSASQTFNWTVSPVVNLTAPDDQSNNEGDNVSLQLSATGDSGLTYGASGLPSGLSINGSTGLISGTVASGDADNGPYTVTITATDTQGNRAAQQFTWNVNAPANALSLTNPGNQSNAEGDTVSLQVQASDPDGDTLEYAASGLPIGLMIDPNTGLISGTVDYSAAEISGGQYQVTVTVNDGNGDTASQSFLWTIADTPQPPWLEYPEFQDSQNGTAASLQLIGGSPDGKTLTYSATGLPAGLSVNPNTGLISGTITAAMGSYTVTATVSDGTQTASQTFTWQVTCEAAPQVLLSFDGQPAGGDFLAEVDPATPISVTVTLEHAGAGMHTIQISIPSGMAEVDHPTFQLADGGSETIELTPEEESQSFDDVLLVAYLDGKEAKDAKGTDAKVTIAGKENGGDIRNKDTPAGMKDRIPPVKDPNAEKPTPWTTVAITITPTLKDAEVVVFQVANNGGANGTVQFLNSANYARPRIYSQESGNLYLVGMAQTAPSLGANGKPDGKGSNAGKLSIVAYAGTQKDEKIDTVDTTKELAHSAGFSVAAIPISIQSSLVPKQVRGDDLSKKDAPKYIISWGVQYNITIKDDSGKDDAKYLNQILISEQIQPDKNNPKSGNQLLPSDFLPGDQPQVDTIAASYLVPKKLGKTAIPLTLARKSALELLQEAIDEAAKKGKSLDYVWLQHFEFKDNITGTVSADGKPLVYTVANSGFKIERVQKKRGATYLVIVTRSGVTVGTAQGASRNKFQAGGTGVSPVPGPRPARRRSHRSNSWTRPQPGSIDKKDSGPQEVKAE